MSAATDIHDYYADNRPSVIFYDLIESTYRPVGPEVAFYLEMAKGIATPVLEAGCGTGRISWLLAEAGYEVLGIDISEPMLERARKKAGLYPDAAARVGFLAADACTMRLESEFDLVLAPYRVFNHLTADGAQQDFLSAMRRHMPLGGRLVFDTVEPPREWQPGRKPPVFDIPHLGAMLERRIVNRRLDEAAQLFIADFRYTLRTASGESYAHIDRLTYRWAPPAGIRRMLERAGLRLLAEYEDFIGSPPGSGRNRVWVVEAV